jgi:formyltetrahydrofolate deformylase
MTSTLPSAPVPATATLLVSCRDRTGLVVALSEFVFKNGGNILDADQHAEVETGLFFMRLRWDLDGFKLSRAEIDGAMRAVAARFDLEWELTYSDVRPRVAVFASKAPHCLYDLLLAHQLGELRGELALVISNHELLRPVAGHFGVRFEHVPVDPRDRAAAEATEEKLLAASGVNLVVLARYMQILSPRIVTEFLDSIINVHHSFLPAFVGARPYHAAFARGVKLIGATSHYVTETLDEGPIIEQDVTRVSHRDQVEDLIMKGRDLERLVLSRAVKWHLKNRILCYGNKTVVFD